MRSSWKVATLGNVCEIVNGGTPKTGVAEYWGGPHQWVTPAEMGRRATPYVDATERTLTDAGLNNSSARLLRPLSVVLSSRAPIGHLIINTVPMATNQGCKGLMPSESLDSKFLYYYLNSVNDLLESLGTGATFKELSSGKLKEVPIAFPSLEEQRRIVAILDKAFESIAIARANAEKNLQNARELLESKVDDEFIHLASVADERRLADVVTRLTNGYVGPTRNIYQDSGVPYLLARHVRNNSLTFDAKTFVSQEFNQKNKKSMLKRGDVLLVQSGHIGHSAVVPREHEGHNCHAMIVLTPVTGVLSGAYLSLFFCSSRMQDRFQEIRSGSTVPHLTCGEVREIKVPIPDIATQGAVVQRCADLERETRNLESTYWRKIAALEELKQSLLHEAFSGKL